MDYLQYRINTALNFSFYRFKPYYKWITFNTINASFDTPGEKAVLNLIINGLPSIRQ